MRNHEDFKIRDGIRFDSVTTSLGIIRKPSLEEWRGNVGNKMADETLKTAGIFGDEIHEYVNMINNGNGYEIDIKKLEPRKAFLVSWFKDWFFENVQEVIYSEKEVFSEKHRYFGHLDSIYLLKNKKKPDIIDIKTGSILDKSVRWQTSAYLEAAKEDLDINIDNRIIIWLPRKNKKCQAIYLDKSTHEIDFLGFIHAKESYKIWNQK